MGLSLHRGSRVQVLQAHAPGLPPELPELLIERVEASLEEHGFTGAGEPPAEFWEWWWNALMYEIRLALEAAGIVFSQAVFALHPLGGIPLVLFFSGGRRYYAVPLLLRAGEAWWIQIIVTGSIDVVYHYIAAARKRRSRGDQREHTVSKPPLDTVARDGIA